MKIIYRISDGGYAKEKPDYIGKIECLVNFMNSLGKVEPYDVRIIADKCSEKTIQKINEVMSHYPAFILHQTSYGNGAASFKFALEMATLNPNDEEIIYFVEDDYVHLYGWPERMKEVFDETKVEFVTLYDHPDKYINGSDGGNPRVEGGGEVTRVIRTTTRHWKLTNSTTMTFAAKVKTLKKYSKIMEPHVNGTHPNDWGMWCDIYTQGGSLVSPIPALATHGETAWLSPGVDWSYHITDDRNILK